MFPIITKFLCILKTFQEKFPINRCRSGSAIDSLSGTEL